MKKITLLLLFVGFTVIGQTTNSKKWEPAAELSPNATTEKEYNYLTVGLKVQLESGLDIINGYTLVPFGVINSGKYEFDINNLKNDTSRIKAVSVVIKSLVDKKKTYLCVPILNQDLMGKYMIEVGKLDLLTARNFALVMSTIYAAQANK